MNTWLHFMIPTTVLIFSLWFFWPLPKCPHCGSRKNLPANPPGHMDCLGCGAKFDSWNA